MLEQQLLNVIIHGSILLLFSLGLSLAWGTLDVLNLGHGTIFVFGAYLGYELGKSTQWPFLVVLAIVIIGSGGITVLMEVVAFSRVRERMPNKRQAELAALVASLGAAVALGQLISNRTQNQIFAPSDGLLATNSYRILGLTVTNVEIIIVVCAGTISLALGYWIRTSRQGRATRAIAYAPDVAVLMGINVRVVSVLIMFLSGALAGLAGLLLAFQTAATNVATGETYMLTAFAILVVGGVGSILGATIAAYGIALGQTAIVAYGNTGYVNAIAFILIFVVLLLRPQGIVSRGATERA